METQGVSGARDAGEAFQEEKSDLLCREPLQGQAR